MSAKPEDDPVLTRFRSAVLDIYGNRVQRMVLYGSRARGEARADSDTDILIEFAPQARATIYDYVALKEYIAGLFDARLTSSTATD